MWLPNSVVADVTKACRIFYLDKEAVRYWNDKRGEGEPLVFTGWYWSKGSSNQGGPFKSQSACYRDAWYHVVMRMEPPSLSRGVTKLQSRPETAPQPPVRRRPPVAAPEPVQVAA